MQKETFREVIQMIFGAVGVSMGIAVAVLNLFDSTTVISSGTSMILLGIGLSCLGISVMAEHA
ncbi:MAG: hypothetical protein ACI32N_07210 [Bulleidia sp.]